VTGTLPARIAEPRLASSSKCSLFAGRTNRDEKGGVVPISREDRDFVQTLERGLAVLHAFDADHETLTLREAADAAGISRPAAGSQRFYISERIMR
jgi:hypothetical protein